MTYPYNGCEPCAEDTPEITVPTPPECVDGEACEEIMSGNCVAYTGAGHTNLGITTDMRMNAVVDKLALGTLRRYDLLITDFGVNINEITPAITATQFWVVHKVLTTQLGGSIPYTDYTNANNDLYFGYNMDDTFTNFETLYSTGQFNYNLADDALLIQPSDTIANIVHDATILGKPVALVLSNYGNKKTATISNAGTGHVISDVITLNTGALVTVTTINAGAVLTYTITGPVAYGVNTQASSTGIGINFAINVTDITPYGVGNGTLKASVWVSLESI